MKYKKIVSIISVLFAICMISSFCGCDKKTGGGPAATASPETSKEGVELYQQAIEKLEQLSSFSLDYQITQKQSYAGELSEESYEGSVKYTDYGRDSVKQETVYRKNGDAEQTTDRYIDGYYYRENADRKYRAELALKDFQEQDGRIRIITPSLYQNIETSKAEDGTVSVIFQNADGYESWFAGEAASETKPMHFETISASARIAPDGSLISCKYECQMDYGLLSRQFRYEYHVTSTGEVLNIELPGDVENYKLLDYIDAPAEELLTGAYRELKESTSMKINYQNYFYSEIDGRSVQEINTLLMGGTGKNFTASQYYQYMTEAGESYTYEETYIDGTLVSAENGESPVKTVVPAEDVFNAYFDAAAFFVLLGSEFVNPKVTDVGDSWIVDYTYSEEGAEFLSETLSEYLYGDKKFLAETCESVNTEMATGYMSFDKMTHLPLAHVIQYNGTILYEGETYAIGFDSTYSFVAPYANAGNEIKGDSAVLPKPDAAANPLFYRVTGTDGKKMWLFGTIHLGDSRTSFLPKKITDAFDSCDALAVEYDLKKAEQMAQDKIHAAKLALRMSYLSGSKITDHVSEETYAAAVLALRKYGMHAVENYNGFKPYFWQALIQQAEIPHYGSIHVENGVDIRLIEQAYEAEKKILEVESEEFQLEMLTGFSDAIQEFQLREVAKTGRDDSLLSVRLLFEMWCQGNETDLTEILTKNETTDEEERKLMEEYNAKILTERNLSMTEKAEEYIESGETVFFAVGLAHLLGEEGIIRQLQDAGYSVERVK